MYGYKILYLEDESTLRKYIRLQLGKIPGVTVYTVDNNAAAISILQQHVIDICILDWWITDLNKDTSLGSQTSKPVVEYINSHIEAKQMLTLVFTSDDTSNVKKELSANTSVLEVIEKSEVVYLKQNIEKLIQAFKKAEIPPHLSE